MPYGITQCYLPPGSGDFAVFTPAEAGTRFCDPGGMQGWVCNYVACTFQQHHNYTQVRLKNRTWFLNCVSSALVQNCLEYNESQCDKWKEELSLLCVSVFIRQLFYKNTHLCARLFYSRHQNLSWCEICALTAPSTQCYKNLCNTPTWSSLPTGDKNQFQFYFKNTHRQTAVSVTHRLNMYVDEQSSLLWQMKNTITSITTSGPRDDN